MSILYWNPKAYNLLMKVLYGSELQKVDSFVASEINGNSVLDLCCGTCRILQYLKNCKSYVGLDASENFVKAGKKKGINVNLKDLSKEELGEKADCVIMLNSLYQFESKSEMIEKMLNAAGKKVVIAEPVKWLVKRKNKLDKKEILELFEKHGASRIKDFGKDIVGVFEKKRA